MKKLLLFLAGLAVGSLAFGAKVLPPLVQGRVTEPSGKPIAGVQVSDGYQVVLTDADGHYSFPRKPEAYYVHISIPSAYEVPLRQGQPVFYKKLEDRPAYDFVLKPLKNGPETAFNLFLVADPQCQWVWHVRRLREEGIADMKASARKAKGPDYAITLGDIAYSEGFRNTNYLLPIIREEFSADKTGMPVFQTIGNHDFEYALTAVEEASPTISVRRNRYFEDIFGPANYSFNRGDVHIVSMFDVCFETFGAPGKYHGDFSDAQVEWLRQDLANVPDGKLVVLCVHIPFESAAKDSPNMQRVMDLLAARPDRQRTYPYHQAPALRQRGERIRRRSDVRMLVVEQELRGRFSQRVLRLVHPGQRSGLRSLQGPEFRRRVPDAHLPGRCRIRRGT